MIKEGADIGIALDGDADRVIIIDEKGQEVDGDQIMGLIALDWLAHDRLRQPGIVTTVMSNLGLERCLNEVGLAMIRANVGDRYVVEQMRAGNYNLGGEQSGHIVLSDFSSTGDGLIAALQVLAVMKRRARKVSEICSVFTPVPQILRNVSYGGGEPLGDSKVVEAIRAAEDVLGRDGRILVRKSGTENLIRVMGEGDDAQAVDRAVSQIVEAVNQVASAA